MNEMNTVILIILASLTLFLGGMFVVYANGDSLQIITMCSLTWWGTGYDCEEKWEIWILDRHPIGVCPNVPFEQGIVRACAYIDRNMIFIPSQEYVNMNRDICGRTVIHHELLHLKYADFPNWVHKQFIDGEECILNW